ncbi:GWxTD domain-containing protein [bacterium SCSIO 12741]|nr:GWxTD domain-containing protein [bacterium SCSIO 12741]
MEINIRDVNNKGNGFSGSQKIDVYFDSGKIQWSTIELVESYKPATQESNFTKSGIDIIPNVTDYYPDHVGSLKFYTEVYHSDSVLKSEKFLIKYYIAQYETNQPLPQYIGFIRQNPAPVGIVLREFNIEKLASGNYLLVVEARDRSNNLLSFTSSFFQRSNVAADTAQIDLDEVITQMTFVEKYNNIDTLQDYVRSIRPLADRGEESFIDQQTKRKAEPEVDVLKKFLYHFWAKRYPLSAGVEWAKYQKEVEKVNASFGTSIRQGYDTDRGRVYLKYGPPNNRIEVPSEPNSYPYEIWHYFKIANQTDGRFVFYNDDLITNDFTLLHSTVFGEIQNERWEMILQSRNTPMNDLDQTDPGNTYGSRARYYFNNPR